MIEEVKTYDIERLTKVSRAFTHFLALSNSAENHHRVRKTKIRLMKAKYGLSVKDDSLGGNTLYIYIRYIIVTSVLYIISIIIYYMRLSCC